jgi:diacylglycerol O-acyltransferase / wax synthase
MSDEASKRTEQGWEELGLWGRDPDLNELDTLMWRTERHPSDSWTGVVIEVFDSDPTWEVYRGGAERALSLVPRFRQRVVDPLLPIGPPRWDMDPLFDLDYHVRRVRLPEPGSMAQLLELAQQQALEPIDRSRPPWVRLYVEGLEGGRAATIFQCQHVLTDGFAYAQLMARLYKPAPDMEVKLPGRPLPESEEVSPAGLTARSISRAVRGLPGAGAKAIRGAARAVAHPRSSAGYASSLRRVLDPPPASTSSLLGGGHRTKWRFGTLECGLDELKAAGRSAGGSVNDAFVSATLGGIRLYHDRVGAEIGDIPISMPVAMRSGSEAAMEAGNRFAGAFFSAPAGEADPAERIVKMRAKVEDLRDEVALDFIGQLTPVMNRAPSSVVGAAIRSLNASVDLTLSNWPGVPKPIYIREAQMTGMFVFGPLPGTAMCAALNSHAGTCCIGINVDGEVFEDLDGLWACMREGLDEVLALGTAK